MNAYLEVADALVAGGKKNLQGPEARKDTAHIAVDYRPPAAADVDQQTAISPLRADAR